MGHFRDNIKSHSLMKGIGDKVRNVAELAGTLKSIYQAGSAVYAGAQFALPYVEAALPFLIP
jgi:hypothetical protein